MSYLNKLADEFAKGFFWGLGVLVALGLFLGVVSAARWLVPALVAVFTGP